MTDHALTPALEDYLETIYRLMSESGFARVRDIAQARDVRPGSVSPAMKRLDDLGLIQYERREFVRLTDDGLAVARKVYSRHRVLRRFFESFLKLPAAVAEHDACAAEHALSTLTVDRLVRLFEYMEVCPQGQEHLDRFLGCSQVFDDVEPCTHRCPGSAFASVEQKPDVSLADLRPGQAALVQQVHGTGDRRQRLLDLGLLPHTELEVVRVDDQDHAVVIRVQGFELSLSRDEARAVRVAVS